ncbi:outer membrane lipoprotein carrier protein LolA [Pseudonocardia sp.]|uniref:LolA family protein n=1 Tax=Pseudonocardia sp. TaxID=60912 RepID=UPI00260DCD4B|nr:outer membrane lipoprotein carrier protein LolA [Pseudonocardia sp.]
MASRRWTTGRTAAAGIAVAGVVGLGLLALPAGAGAAPVLPPVEPEELVASVLAADPDAFAGTVELDNSLGLPALPELPQAADGTSTARIWSDGDDGGRVQLPTDTGERTLVTDGETFWAWDSADRTVVTGEGGEHGRGPAADMADPTAAAAEAIGMLEATSVVTVDGTAEVAGRPAYELVLAPAPDERTLLREVRIAVDAEQRIPLRLTVLANGSSDPALQVGFTELAFGPQDPSLFTFTPPPGATVESPPAGDARPERERPDGAASTVVGDGWDTVLVATAPTGDAEGMDLSTLGAPVSGPWGSGTLISTAVANAIVTDDGRVAAGAVPEQVLTEALTR